MRGRKPKPTQLKKLAGNPGHRKLSLDDMRPEVAAPVMPSGATKTMREFYKQHAQPLADLRVVTTADATAFHMMATHFDVALDAARRVRKEGLTRIDVLGRMHKHPLLQVFRDNSKAFLAYAVEFGMTPSARSGVQLVPSDRQMTLEEILFGDGAKVPEDSEASAGA